MVSKGFTLIELMIVIAIIGILASIAVPSYKTYTSRATYLEVSDSAVAAKSAIETCLQLKNSVAECDTNQELIKHGFKESVAQKSLLVSSVVVSSPAANQVQVTVTPLDQPAGANFLNATDNYILKASIQTRDSDVFAEGWYVDASSGCLEKGIC